MQYGGLGGRPGGRPINQDDAFELAVDRAFGEVMRRDDAACAEMWSALANIDWTDRDGNTAAYSFRAAGDLVAAIRGRGDYMDWYACAPEGVVSKAIKAAMAREGWSYKPSA